MSTSWNPPKPAAEWHRLLAPLPASADIRRQPVGATPGFDPSSPIDGWEQFVIELAEGVHARRILQVVTDGAGVLLSAGDHVMTMLGTSAESTSRGPADVPESATPVYYHESVGGRFESEDGFQGTHWCMWSVITEEAAASDSGPETQIGRGATSLVPEPEKRPATAAEARELRHLATDVLVRAGVLPPPEPFPRS